MGEQLFFGNYSPVGDIVVISICIVMFILIATSFATRTKSFLLFLAMISNLAMASLTNVIMHNYYIHITGGDYTPIYFLRVLYHFFLFFMFLLYLAYFVHVLDIKGIGCRRIMIVSSFIFLVTMITDVVTMICGTGFRLNSDGTATAGYNIFSFGYLAFILVVAILMIEYRNRMYKNAVVGLAGTIIVSFLILFNQAKHGQSSFTVSTFMFPIFAIMYLLHSNPYDIRTGAVNVNSFTDAVIYSYAKKRGFFYVSMYLPYFHSEGIPIPTNLQKELRQFPSQHFKKSILFRITNGHMFLMIPPKNNPDFYEKFKPVLEAFYKAFEIYRYDYKLVVGHSIDDISKKNDYLGFIKSIQKRMNVNTVHYVDDEDVKAYNRTGDIIKELEDIYKKNDLNDERVLAYCQPVFNIRTGKYDTAEALMRLKLPVLGMVFPDQFISLAEEYDFIHVLTKIILNKTCIAVGDLLREGYEVTRISVNASIPELKEHTFTNDIERIISSADIPEGKIAIEITESQSESDQKMILNMIDELKGVGTKFYLDDFGTGYSNMERIMKLPFDIIKFDRSLVIASKTDKRSEEIVRRLAGIFADLDYSVLYEGIEDEDDENRCINMYASYLQGYKYSKPVPIEELRNFFSKKSDNT